MLKSITNLNKKNFSTDSFLLINLVFGFFPISFIFGNFVTNANLILFCALGIFHLRSKIFKTKFNLSIRIIFLFFFVIFFSTSLSFIKSLYFEGYEYVHLVRLVKSIIFFRYFLMFIIIYLLSEHNILNFKYFFISAFFSALIVALDVIYQYIFGFNIIGLKGYPHHNSGFFGDEWISGGFIQNFSFFSILFLAFLLENKKILRFILTVITICILGAGIMLSGNKMPLILFLFGLLLVILFNNQLRNIILVSLVCFFILFKFIISTDADMKTGYVSMYQNIQSSFVGIFDLDSILKNDSEKNYETQKNSTAAKEKDQLASSVRSDSKLSFLEGRTYQTRLILTAIDTWKQNKIFGNGIKSFRIDCHRLQGEEYNLQQKFVKFKKNRTCSNHPHNYYFEILTETGIVGFFIILIIALLFLIFILKNFRLFKGNTMENFILLGAVISLILEAFPIKSSGSIFTTNDTTYIILISSIILSYKKKLTTSGK